MHEPPLILTVDDDLQINLGMKIRIRSAGLQSIDAGDGLEGIAVAIKQRPDVIVADIRMPKLDGLSMLRELKQHPDTASIPVIMVSANAAELTRAEAKKYGAYCFLEKPYSSVSLLQAIQSALASRDTGALAPATS